MAAGRPSSLCLFCQARQALIGRRRVQVTKRRRLETLALQPLDKAPLPGSDAVSKRKAEHIEDARTAEKRASVVVGEKLQTPQLKNGVREEVQEALQGLEALWERKDMRIKILRTLSNPWPEIRHGRGHNEVRQPGSGKWYLPEAPDGPIPHSVFRHNLSVASSEKVSRQILRAQLLRCETPTDILRVVAVAMLHKRTQLHLSVLHEPIMRALYRCRPKVDDSEVMRTLVTIYSRFNISYGLPVDPQFVALGLKFAARTRSLKHMKRFLKVLKDRNLRMSSNVFRSVIAKFSIGHRGLGEIRNGRWRRSELLQVLTGFDDCKHLPPEQQYHFGTFLDRNDWQYLHGWVAVLARCRDSEAVWHEWQLWKQSEARRRPKRLATMHRLMTSKLRGDFWFVEQMTYAGDLEKAWQILAETGVEFVTLKDRIKTKLLEGVEYATIWNDDIRRELIRKYDADLCKIEAALGVRWESAGTDDHAEGQHVLVKAQEEVLERLGADEWKLDEDYGFPYDELPILPQSEKSLHSAAETTPAEPDERTIR